MFIFCLSPPTLNVIDKDKGYEECEDYKFRRNMRLRAFNKVQMRIRRQSPLFEVEQSETSGERSEPALYKSYN